jgi:hypothetical protein
MRTSIRIASVLTGLTLALGGVAFTAAAAHADVTVCINQVERELQGGRPRTPSGWRVTSD